ncbi:class I SAM-dependent methyltransferase [Haloarchaeobius sp. TZWWS8]|uniref:class I SAM-dependent methyltransferase n=1 Tax=Haloarchaeobius sp. TZWWS8 TaxID=3446121 RepID=UPI003EBCDBEA
MVEKETVRRGYDQLATVHDAERDESGQGMTILDEFLDACTNLDRVLDAGCGSGRPVLRLLTERADAVGLDVSAGQLRLACERAPAAALLQGDMASLPFAADSFDAVVAFWSLIHVPEDEHQRVLDEFARVCRPDGRVLVCEASGAWNGENPDWLDEGVEMQWNMAGAEATLAQLEDAGFSVEQTWGAPTSLEWDRKNAADDDGTTDGNGNGEAAENEAADDAAAENGGGENEDDESPWTFIAARLPA